MKPELANAIQFVKERMAMGLRVEESTCNPMLQENVKLVCEGCIELDRERQQANEQYEIIGLRILAQKDEMGNTIDALKQENSKLRDSNAAAVARVKELEDQIEDAESVALERGEHE